MHERIHVKYRYLAVFWRNFNSIGRFSKIFKIPYFMKVSPMVAELFHPDGRTEMTKRTVPFSQFCERAQKHSSYLAVNTRDLHYGNTTINIV
jgi:hypothetical protein